MEHLDASTGKKPLVLILDRNNVLGGLLAEKVSDKATVVLVSKTVLAGGENIIFVPLSHGVPQIPDFEYQDIFFVWGEGDDELLEPLVQKAKERGTRVFLITSLTDKKTAVERARSVSEDVTILILGDLFGEKVDSSLENFLFTIKETKKITLSQMGLYLWYPTLLVDVIDKLVHEQTTFVSNRTYFLGPKHPVTALNIAHTIQKIDPDVIIDFSSDVSEERNTIGKDVVAFSDYDSLGKIKEAYKNLVINKRSRGSISTSAYLTTGKKNKKNSKWPFYAVYVIGVLLLLPFLVGLISGGMGAVFLTTGFADIKSGNIARAQQKIGASRQSFAFSKEAFDISMQEAGLVGEGSLVSFFQAKAAVGLRLSQVFDDSVAIVEKMTLVFSGKTLSPKNEISESASLARHISILSQEIPVKDVPLQYQANFLAFQKLSMMLSGVIDELPSVLGVAGDKSFLVLFQNNMELRPGGGFIGSYGLLKLHNGAIKEFSIHDVYDADGQLKGHVEPPFAIRRYIPIVHLYLRDSNFDPDFLKNAQTAAFLLSQETGDKVDGVIGVDLETVKAALSAVNEVYVPSYNETVTQKNFFPLIEKHAEKNFFPGSTQKKDFLNAFFVSLVDTFQNHRFSSAQSLIEQAVLLLQGKHVLIAFSDPLIQAPFSLANLSGTLLDTRASASAGVVDFFGVSEANLGINKVNAFVSRKLSHQVTIDEKGIVTDSGTLTLVNDSDGSWPGGVYKNYIRFILPDGITIKNISINNVEQNIVAAVVDPLIYEKKSFTAPAGLEVAQEKENGKTIIGFLITVPEKNTTTINVTYLLPGSILVNGLEQKYSLYLWKQPGVGGYPYALHMLLPSSMQLVRSSVLFKKENDNMSFMSTLASDAIIDSVLAKK